MSIYHRLTDGARIEIDAPTFAKFQLNGKASGLRLFSIDTRPVPTALQRVEVGPLAVDATTARQTWLVIDKTAPEITDDTARAQRVTDLQVMLAGTGTAAERLLRLERLVLRLAREVLL